MNCTTWNEASDVEGMSSLNLAYSLAADLSGGWTWKVIDPDGVILKIGLANDEQEATRRALGYIAQPAHEAADGSFSGAQD
jgi:hypothetical protein